jgi:hypothetical protein
MINSGLFTDADSSSDRVVSNVKVTKSNKLSRRDSNPKLSNASQASGREMKISGCGSGKEHFWCISGSL